MSARYNWNLASSDYILSLESILGGMIFFFLQYLDSRSSTKSLSTTMKRRQELLVAKISIVCRIIGSICLGFSETRAGFYISALIICGRLGFLDATKAFFTGMLENHGDGKADIKRLYNVSWWCSMFQWYVPLLFGVGFMLGATAWVAGEWVYRILEVLCCFVWFFWFFGRYDLITKEKNYAEL